MCNCKVTFRMVREIKLKKIIYPEKQFFPNIQWTLPRSENY